MCDRAQDPAEKSRSHQNTSFLALEQLFFEDLQFVVASVSMG